MTPRSPTTNTRAAALNDMVYSLERELEQIDECLSRMRLPPEPAMKGVSIGQLQAAAVLSGHLSQLDQTYHNQMNAFWREKYFLLTSEGDLFAFQNTTRDTLSETFLAVKTCSGYWQETCQSWVLQIIGSVLRRDGVLHEETWFLRVVSSQGLLLWLNAINKAVITAKEVRMHVPQSLGTEREVSVRTLSIPMPSQCSSPTNLSERVRESPTPSLLPTRESRAVNSPEPSFSSMPRSLSMSSTYSSGKQNSVRGKKAKWWTTLVNL
ncbi:hypothetical protein BJ741DRAFT_603484 [Chytriomyces cf. hyalinus JEL632]|nr:hypothetical protein BJ741DRAFT_603484 [Chytriomyces cf. hyalinus JEL632]